MFEHEGKIKTIPGFPNYAITENGGIWSKRWKRWLKIRKVFSSYPKVCLRWGKGGKITTYVHRLVLETFIGPCPDGMEARHLDGDNMNNNVNSLCWGTHSENAKDMVKHGRSFFGSKENIERRRLSGQVKLMPFQVLRIRKMLKIGILSTKQIGTYYGVSKETVLAIKNNKTWKNL